MRYKRIGYNINVMRQSACLVINPITVDSFASLFNCTPVGRASVSVILLLAVPRRLFCFGSLVVLDVVFRYLSLFLLYINIKIGKNRCLMLD